MTRIAQDSDGLRDSGVLKHLEAAGIRRRRGEDEQPAVEEPGGPMAAAACGEGQLKPPVGKAALLRLLGTDEPRTSREEV